MGTDTSIYNLFSMYTPLRIAELPYSQVRIVKETYKGLCLKFLDASPDNPFYDYVKSAIANDATLDRHVRAFELYAPYITPKMRVLDWGCRHAPDSCMMRSLHPELDLHGCDIMQDDFSVFHDYARLSFKQLTHVYELPYEDQSFDAVLSSGVLEHVAFEFESVREIWRVLKDDGLLFVTFLPNSTSLTENVSRLIGSFGGHNRLYDLARTKNMFLRSGFVVERCGFHQVLPSFGKNMKSGKWLNAAANIGATLNRNLERVWGINAMAANIFFVLRRVLHM